MNSAARDLPESAAPVCSSNLTLIEAATSQWDVLVIGAGVAGSLAARELAQAGLKTLLVERKQFPRQKVCGGCLSALGLSVLANLGLGDICERLGALPVNQLQISRAGKVLNVPLPEGRAISRASLDAGLAATAIEAGAQILTQTKAEVDPAGYEDRGFRSVQLQGSDEKQLTVRARVVLAADGLGHSSLQRLPEFASQIDPQSLVGLGTLLSGQDDELGRLPPGTIFMAVGKCGYVGMVRVERNQINVAAAVDRSWLQWLGGDCPKLMTTLFRSAGMNPPKGLAETQWQGTPPLTRKTRCLATQRLFVLGDAAGYVEPFTGEGMSWAAMAAAAVAPIAERAVYQWNDSLCDEWNDCYRGLVGRNQFVCRMLAKVLRRPYLSAAAMQVAKTFPGVTASVVRRLNRPLQIR